MFGIRVTGRFIDLASKKFNMVLKNPFYLQSTDDDVIQGSVLLSFKAEKSVKNIQILGKVNLTQGSEFKKNEPCEIWSNGSHILSGLLSCIETSMMNMSISVAINRIDFSEMLLKDENLFQCDCEYDWQTAAQYARPNQRPDSDFPLRLPIIYAPQQFGDTTTYGQSFQNAAGRFGAQDFTSSPAPKVIETVKQLFKIRGYDVSHTFENHPELSELISYSGFVPANANDKKVDVKRWLPQKMKTADYVKQIVRSFNTGIVSNSIDRTARIMQPFQNNDVTDWSKIVSKSYTMKSNPLQIGGLTMVVPEMLTKGLSVVEPWVIRPIGKGIIDGYRYENFGHAADDPNAHKGLKTQIPTAEISVGTSTGKINIKYLILPPTKIFTARPEYWGDPTHFWEDTSWTFPSFFEKNGSVDNLRLLFFRGLNYDVQNNPYLFASAESHHADGRSIKYGIGYRNNVFNSGTNCEYSLRLEGETGIYNRFWKTWIDFLSNKNEVIFDVMPTVKILRSFQFDQKINIRNKQYFLKELSVQFSENGIDGGRGTFIQI